MGKRQEYLSWDGYFMAIAFISSLRSKDPNTRHGACIVNSKNRIVGTGYNGFPTGCSDDDFSWDRDGKETKYQTVVHSEVNAILNSNTNLDNCRMYLYSEGGYYPCSECAKVIIQSGIKEVVMATEAGLSSPKYNDYKCHSTLKMFNASKVSIRTLEYYNISKAFMYLQKELNGFVNTFV